MHIELSARRARARVEPSEGQVGIVTLTLTRSGDAVTGGTVFVEHFDLGDLCGAIRKHPDLRDWMIESLKDGE